MLSILLILALFASASAKTVKVVGAYYKPFFYKCGNSYCGLDIDILNAVRAFYNYNFQIEVVPFKEALDRVREGKAQMAIGAIYVTEQRKRWFNYTVPYLETGLVVVVRTDQKLLSLEDLRGAKVCVKKGATGEKIALNLRDRYRWDVITRNSTLECFRALAKGNVDALLNDFYNSVSVITEKYLGKMRILKDSSGYIMLQKATIAYPVAKGEEELLNHMNRVITGLKRLGRLDVLVSKWFPVELMEKGRYPKRVIVKAVATAILATLIPLLTVLLLLYARQKRRELRLYRNLLGAMPVAVLILDSRGRIVYNNREASKVIPHIKISRLLEGPEEIQIEEDGKRWFYKTVSPLDRGEILISLLDITPRKEIEKERELINKHSRLETLGQITYQLAHDFNNVLNLVMNSLSMAIGSLEEDTPVKRILTKSYEECLRFSDFASKLVKFAKSPVEKPYPLNLKEFIDSWKKTIARMAGRNIKVDFNLQETGTVAATEGALTQIIINLVTNARDALKGTRDPRITISTSQVDVNGRRYALLEVKDNGPGIPEEIMPKIFNPFFTTKESGSGVGLFTVYSIVRGLGGHIEVESTKGETVFKIYLPVLD